MDDRSKEMQLILLLCVGGWQNDTCLPGTENSRMQTDLAPVFPDSDSGLGTRKIVVPLWMLPYLRWHLLHFISTVYTALRLVF